jgi:hypothetical protein
MILFGDKNNDYKHSDSAFNTSAHIRGNGSIEAMMDFLTISFDQQDQWNGKIKWLHMDVSHMMIKCNVMKCGHNKLSENII